MDTRFNKARRDEKGSANTSNKQRSKGTQQHITTRSDDSPEVQALDDSSEESLWGKLPEDVCLSLVSRAAEDADKASARLVCEQWAHCVSSCCRRLSVTGSGPAGWVSTFRNLEDLDWKNPTPEGADGSGGGGVAELCHLKSLRLQGMKSIDLDWLSMLPGLTRLDLSSYSRRHSCVGGAAALSCLERLKGLRDLSLRNCRHLNDGNVAHLLHLRGLTALNLRGCCNVQSAGLYELGSLASLETLDLTDCAVTDGVVYRLSSLSHIKVLRLGRCEIINETMANLGRMVSLTCLDLTGCDGITSHGIVHLRSLPLLSTLNLFASTVKNKDLTELKHLRALRSLDIGYCAKVSGPGLADIRTMTSLTELNVSGSSVSNTALTCELKRLVNLTSLNLSSCKVTDEGLSDLGHLKGLTRLALNLCNVITACGVVRLVQRLGSLHTLSMCGCRRIPSRMMPSLKKRLPPSVAIIY